MRQGQSFAARPSLISPVAFIPLGGKLEAMISASVDQSGHVLTITYGRRVGRADTREALRTLKELAPRLKPGFILLSDLTMLDSMEGDCAEDISAMAELLNRRGVATIVRVIPDPAKDIGFNIISLFHLGPPVKIHARPNLAEAVSLLLQLQAAAAAPTPSASA
jgi:hypothetical protein